MIAFVLSEKEGYNEIKNLGYSSCENINIFDKNLAFYQDLCIECSENLKKYKVFSDEVLKVKRIIESSSDEYSVFFYENCFFDFSVREIFNCKEEMVDSISYYNKSGKLVFAIVCNNKFKKMFLKDFSLYSVESLIKSYCAEKRTDFYYKFLDTYTSYKELIFDILNGQNNVYVPNVAKGVYTDGKLPKGDYTIIPPVYISSNSQIENGCVIGPLSAVLSNSLVAKNSRVSASIISENAYVSSECLIENSICGKNASVKRGGAIINGCVLGYDAVLGNDMCLENNEIVLPETRIYAFKNDHRDSLCFDTNNNRFDSLNVITACKLGLAFGTAFNTPSVCVGNDDNLNSSIVKMAFLSGLCSSGCDCYDIGSSFINKLFYTSQFCKLQFCFFFTYGENGVSLKVFNSSFDEIRNSEFFNLMHFYKKLNLNEIYTADNIKKIKQIKGLGKLYVRDLKNLLPEKMLRKYYIKCDNLSIQKLIDNIFSIKNTENEKETSICFYINASGTELSCDFGKNIYKRYDLVSVLEKIDNTLNDNDFIAALYKRDAVVLFFKLISFFEGNPDNIRVFKENLQNLSVIDKEVFYKIHTGEFISNLIFNGFSEYKNGKLYIINNDENISFKINPSNKSLRLLVKSYNAEASQEISKEIDAILGDINKL